MEVYELEPPFEPDLLREIAEQAWEHNWRDLTDTVAWLLTQQSVEGMTQAVRATWADSSLLFREWAERIDVVQAWATPNDLGLRVTLLGEGRVIDQCPPLDRATLRHLRAKCSAPIPAVLEDLAAAAPGLSIDHNGQLAHPSFFRCPMTHMTNWVADMEEYQHELEEHGAEFPDPGKYLVEVLQTSPGDLYVLAPDHSLHFFDHEEYLLYPCRASVEDLVSVYLQHPTSLINPEGLAWVDSGRPTVPVQAEPEPDKNLDESERLREHLPTLALLALALKAWDRGWPHNPEPNIDHSWRKHAEVLRSVAERCRAVCVTGVELAENVAATMAEALNTAEDDWSEQLDDVDWRFDGETLADTLREIVTACSTLDDWSMARGRDWSLETSIVGPDLWGAMEAASVADANYLLSLDLGEPNARGRTVPAAFFDRPQWPNG